MISIKFANRRSAFSFIEIVITAAIALTSFSAIIFVTSSTRVDIARSVNYMIANEIALETLDLIQSAPFDASLTNKIQIFDGSLVDPNTESSVEIPRAMNSKWNLVSAMYPDQYKRAWFYRRVRFENVGSDITNSRFLHKITVEVYWNEGQKPVRIESLREVPDRMRKVAASSLMFNEREHY